MPVPKQKVIDIIKDGGIPLITAHRNSTGQIKLDITKANRKVKYTAITHVWADGLVNDPTFFRRSKKSVTFWIDTLCIPVHGGYQSLSMEEVAIMKRDAISRMTLTYAGAQRVLMLDSELAATPFSAPVEEVLGRILRSAWIGRCWTFQEMSLAPRLVIKMANGYFDLERAIRACLEIMDPKNPNVWPKFSANYISESQQALVDMTEATKPASVHRRRTRDGKSFDDPFKAKRLALQRWAVARDKASFSDLAFIPSPFLNRSLGAAQISYVWNNMMGRSTTQWEDVYGIFANLLNFRVKDIESLPQDERMKAMLCAQESIPIRLLFQHSPPLMGGASSDRWVPQCPKGNRLDEQGYDVDYAYVIADCGFLIKHAGLTTPHGGGVICVWIPPSFPRHRRFSFVLTGYGRGRWWVELVIPTDSGGEHEESKSARFLILDYNGISKYDPAPAGCSYASSGAILSNVRREGNIVTGAYDSPVSFGPWKFDEDDVAHADLPVVSADLVYDIEVRIETGICPSLA
ncbi:MAG: hypothetical protein Q9190_003806 [Brigantiaea leucoxantha]